MIKKILEDAVRSLATNPGLVIVHENCEGGSCSYEIEVSDADRGRIIGKDGQTIRALRMLVQAAVSDDQTVMVTVR